MSKRSIESRLTLVERQLTSAKGEITEIYITGGLDPGVRAHILGGGYFEGEPGEGFDSLRARVRAIAEADRAKAIVYGGMRPPPTEWAEPPGMEEALVKAAWRGTDEMDKE
jgi:hypothetical protein